MFEWILNDLFVFAIVSTIVIGIMFYIIIAGGIGRLVSWIKKKLN